MEARMNRPMYIATGYRPMGQLYMPLAQSMEAWINPPMYIPTGYIPMGQLYMPLAQSMEAWMNPPMYIANGYRSMGQQQLPLAQSMGAQMNHPMNMPAVPNGCRGQQNSPDEQSMGAQMNPPMNMPAVTNGCRGQQNSPNEQSMGAPMKPAMNMPAVPNGCIAPPNSPAVQVHPIEDAGVDREPRIDDLRSCVAVDCEFYKINGESALGRVSIVDHEGNILLDTFVRHDLPPTDFVTSVSGIRPENLIDAPFFSDVQMRVAEIFQGKIVVGHDLDNDFKVLRLHHPIEATRDTSTHQVLKDLVCSRKRGKIALKELARCVFGEVIQNGQNCTVTDARMAMRLFHKVHERWHNY